MAGQRLQTHSRGPLSGGRAWSPRRQASGTAWRRANATQAGTTSAARMMHRPTSGPQYGTSPSGDGAEGAGGAFGFAPLFATSPAATSSRPWGVTA